MSGLHERFDELVADVPTYGDLDRAIERAGREDRRRRGTVAGLAAAAVVALVLGTAAVVDDDSRSQRPPVGPVTPAPTPTETSVPGSPMTNGRLTSAERWFTAALDPCFVLLPDGDQSVVDISDWVDRGGGDCQVVAVDFDAVTELGLFAESAPVDTYGKENPPEPVTTWRVGTADRVLARVPCPGSCFGNAALGPGAREISVTADGQEVRVVGFDGTVRRTIDLAGVLPPPGTGYATHRVVSVEWSPDRSQAAVVTGHRDGQIWLVDRDGGNPRLVHSVTNTEPLPQGHVPLVYLSSLEWSPDGTRLAFVEELASIGGYEDSIATQALLLDVSGPSDARTLYALPDDGDQLFDVAVLQWAPDGTRIALKLVDRVLELSPDDGRVLARLPSIEGTLIWPSRQR
jgi:hypothetical protein